MENIDPATIICNMGFKLPFPFGNRSFVVVGYLAADPVTKSVLYASFSHHDEQDIKRAKPKGVLADIEAVFMVTPTTEGCKVVMYSRCDLKSASLSALAGAVSKEKPKQVGIVHHTLERPCLLAGF